jgi:hypothetical protein
MFSHKAPGGAHDFLRLTTASGASVRLTPGHLLPVNGALATARSAVVGDVVSVAGAGGAPVADEAVVDVRRERAAGLFNPHTAHGSIVVDGVVCSTYTEAVPAWLAHHVLLAPCRAAWRLLGVECGAVLHGEAPAGAALRFAWSGLLRAGAGAVGTSEL